MGNAVDVDEILSAVDTLGSVNSLIEGFHSFDAEDTLGRDSAVMKLQITLVMFFLTDLAKGLVDGEDFDDALRKTISGERPLPQAAADLLRRFQKRPPVALN